MAHSAASSKLASARKIAARRGSRLRDPRGRRILVVEDQFYVADDLATAFAGLGVDVLGPVPT